jgi:hypothetical protein
LWYGESPCPYLNSASCAPKHKSKR